MVFTLEGGYDLTALAWSIRGSLEALLDEERAPDPLGRRDHPQPPVIDELLSAVGKVHGLDGV